MESFEEMLNKEIVKKSGKPFPNKKLVEIPISIVQSLHTEHLSFVFSGDGRLVECRICKLKN